MEQDFTRPGAYNLLGSGNGSLGDEMNKSINPAGRGSFVQFCVGLENPNNLGFWGFFSVGAGQGPGSPLRELGTRDPNKPGKLKPNTFTLKILISGRIWIYAQDQRGRSALSHC